MKPLSYLAPLLRGSSIGWRRWLSNTSNLVHISVLVFVPALLVLIIEIGVMSQISYFLFPPLASASFTLFSDPDGDYSNPRNLIGGLTLGAFIGWASFTAFGYGGVAAGIALFVTGTVTWFGGFEHPSAFSATLLAVVLKADSYLYVISVLGATAVVGGVFYVWKTRFYDVRSEYLYEHTWSDDRVLVPIRQREDTCITDFAAQIAGAHEAGRVVLLNVTEDENVIENARKLEDLANEIREGYDVNVEVSILEAELDDARAVLDAAERYSCDLIAVPWEGESGVSDYISSLFGGDRDVVVYRPSLDEEKQDSGPWHDVLVPVKGDDELSRLMVDFASRLVGKGAISVSKIISNESERRSAEKDLFDLVDGFTGRFETRVTNVSNISREEFISKACSEYDLMLLGASTDRPVASRFFSPPMVEQVINKVDIPVVIVHSESASR
ncbi:HPP family protein [Halorutilales archaeon Cl-col2-1]